MKFYMIRTKYRPDLYVGKSSPSYAMHSDQALKINVEWERDMRNQRRSARELMFQGDENKPPYWFVPKERAKIWGGVSGVKRFIGCCRAEKTDTFGRYEIEICDTDSGVTVMPLEEFLKQ